MVAAKRAASLCNVCVLFCDIYVLQEKTWLPLSVLRHSVMCVCYSVIFMCYRRRHGCC